MTSCLLKEETRVLLCLDRADGKVLWQRDVVHSPLEPKHKLNSYRQRDAGQRRQACLGQLPAAAAEHQ